MDIETDSRLISMPPEIIENIYKSTGTAEMVKLSMTHPYIYDCRPNDLIDYRKNAYNHSKKFNAALDTIKSMSYTIKDETDHERNIPGYKSTRILNGSTIVYYHYDNGNLTAMNHNRREFTRNPGPTIALYPVEIIVYMNVYNNCTHMLFFKGSANVLYSDNRL